CASALTEGWAMLLTMAMTIQLATPAGDPHMEVPDLPPVHTSEDCKVAANRGPAETEFDCALRLDRARRAGGPGRSLGIRVAPDGSDIPTWALDDPAAWEVSQCGAAGDDACRRQVRNQLAMARAGLATETPAAGGGAAENCRMVMRRSQDGFGGSLSRVCGDEAEAEAALNRLDGALRPTVEPCDRPASLETQEAWMARCRALPAH
ncbi:MAG: hypothetical protein Q8K90_05940, partial [Brevundimonas sp.]|nr:hypothetical protein [Brevundimonas sp.]